MKALDLNDLRIFARVVDRGAFAVVARELGVPTSTVSRTIARLEASTGTRLLQRTPRSLRPTSEGRALHVGIRDAVDTLDRAAHALEPATRKPKGVLRVSAPVELASTFLADVAIAFSEQYPLVELDMVLTNRAVNLVEEGFDVAIRASLRLPDSSVVAKKLGEAEHALFASPSYLAKHGVPSSPRELGEHRCIVFRGKDLEKTWRLHDDRETLELAVRGKMAGDDFTFVRALALAGGGIALMPRLFCAKDVASGHLVRVLSRYAAKGASLFIMYPSAAHVPARVATFRDFVAARFHASLPRGP